MKIYCSKGNKKFQDFADTGLWVKCKEVRHPNVPQYLKIFNIESPYSPDDYLYRHASGYCYRIDCRALKEPPYPKYPYKIDLYKLNYLIDQSIIYETRPETIKNDYYISQPEVFMVGLWEICKPIEVHTNEEMREIINSVWQDN